MPNKIDTLAEIAPAGVIEMYAALFPQIPPANRTEAIQYLRSYATVYYSPAEVPADITESINALEAKIWLVQQ